MFHPFAPPTDDFDNLESNKARPLTDAILTVRVIKSFEYRSMKALVLKDCDLTVLTVGELKERCKKEIVSTPAFKVFRFYVDQLDTLKLYTRAHGSKTTNLIINLDHDDWILDDPEKTLAELGAENETELSLFNRAAYEAFKLNPATRWDETG